jgi:hypothetical protein
MKRMRALLAGALLVMLGTSQTLAQNTPMKYADLFALPGKVVAAGANANPVGPLGLKTYRIEELTLPPGTTIDMHGTTVKANSAWRVVIVGTSFQIRALPPIVSIDSTDLPAAQESTNLQEIAAITFDRALIHDNAVLSLSYGSQRAELPERVKLASRR